MKKLYLVGVRKPARLLPVILLAVGLLTMSITFTPLAEAGGGGSPGPYAVDKFANINQAEIVVTRADTIAAIKHNAFVIVKYPRKYGPGYNQRIVTFANHGMGDVFLGSPAVFGSPGGPFTEEIWIDLYHLNISFSEETPLPDGYRSENTLPGNTTILEVYNDQFIKVREILVPYWNYDKAGKRLNAAEVLG